MPKIVLYDVTDSTWRKLQSWPYGLNIPSHPSALCLKDIVNCKKQADREIGNEIGFLLPPHLKAREVTDWDPIDFKGQILHLQPTNAVHKMADGWLFLTDPILDGNHFHVEVNKNISANFRVHILRVEYDNVTQAWPMLITVAIPNDWDRDTSFVVYIQNPPQDQNFFRLFDAPFGWDWLFFHGWKPLNNSDAPLIAPARAWGLPYQIRRAGKKAILVIPQIPFVAEKTEQFRILSFATLRDLLKTIQDFLLPTSRDTNNPATTLVGFSNGNNILTNMITSNMAAPKGSPNREAITSMLERVIAFDPPEVQWAGNALIKACLAFRKNFRPSLEFRLYTHNWYDQGFAILFKELGWTSIPSKRFPFYVRPGNRHSIGYFPINKDGDIWEESGQHTLDLLNKGSNSPRWDRSLRNFQNIHLWFPALFMTDAIR
ncbi:MAG: hypothetical protein KME20_20725 [Kaiparowitsia implicata GSE-PSE-MK54-09C]|jgi:hypothetical protein|nr:hypothetical protein [Kaiparowitsia implicata GSE-PSE-MK54-09C]